MAAMTAVPEGAHSFTLGVPGTGVRSSPLSLRDVPFNGRSVALQLSRGRQI